MVETDEIVRYEADGRIARITLNRPDRYNAIAPGTPRRLREAVERANDDDGVHVIVLAGEGEAFCAGYDLERAESGAGGAPEMPWDPVADYRSMRRNTDDFMSLWRSYKPTICAVQGYAVGGGSDIALCADLVVMGEEARIGYPPARVWGCPTTAMWVYRVGAETAKRLLLTGDLITGREAADVGLVYEAVPGDHLEARVDALADRMASVPRNQLAMQKLAINAAYENMGLETTQTLATFFDGMARHTPEGVWFRERMGAVGWKRAVAERDGGDPIDELMERTGDGAG